jgi:succinate-acetate transporter protein
MNARGINLSLRYLGIVLPLVVVCFYSWSWVPHFGRDGYVALSLFLWLVFTVLLAIRRDWSGALAMSVIYALINVPFLLLLLGIRMAGMTGG